MRIQNREQTPTFKNKKKLRKVSNIKNSFSLRVSKKTQKRRPKYKKSKISESEHDFSSNREYSEEQGRKANYLFSNHCVTNSVLTKPDTKIVDISKSTLSSLKQSRAKSIMNSGKNRRYADASLASGESSWNSETMSILHSVKPRKYDKLGGEKKLESIFKIYNRNDMISKVNTLRKNNHKENFRSNNFKVTTPNQDEYDSSYFCKLGRSKTKINTSLNSFRNKSNNLIPEVIEGEMSQDATPNSSSKKIKHFHCNEDHSESLRKTINNFNGDIQISSDEARHQLVRKATHTSKNRRMLKTYMNNNMQMKTFVPLRAQQMTASEVKSNIQEDDSYLPVETKTLNSRESPDNRLSKIYVRSGYHDRGTFRNAHFNRNNCSLQRSIPRNEYMPSSLRGNSYMDLSKPLFHKRHLE